MNKLKATRGKVLEFLEMTLDLSKLGKVTVDTKKYVEEMFEDFSLD